MEDRLILTVEEAGRKLGLSRGTTYTAIHTGQIPYIRIGKRILVPCAALEKMLDGAGKAKEA